MLVGISEHLLAGGRAARPADDPHATLAALVDFHVDFALREPELIVVQDRDLANLPESARRRVRLLQRTYVEIWVDTLREVHPGDVRRSRPDRRARGVRSAQLHAVLGQMGGPGALGVDVLRRMALAALGVG